MFTSHLRLHGLRCKLKKITSREIALIWRINSPREEEFRLLAEELRAG